MGYGYLWWKPSETRSGPEWVGSWLAYGNYGQFILGLPAMETVIVHRRAVTDEFAIARNMGKTQASPAGGPFEAVAFLAIADMVVAARA
jgi:CubicO group peptidase (beta-lactamase class C family)